jgi:hypothetical protein
MNYFHARILFIDAPAPSCLIFGASIFDICKRLARVDGIASAQSHCHPFRARKCKWVMKKISRLDRRKIRHKDVLSLQLARDPARQSKGGSDGHVSLSVSNSETIEFGHQRLLDELEAENAELRGHVVDLLLQLQASRDDAG